MIKNEYYPTASRVSEYNYDVAERSFYFDVDQSPLGRLSKPFIMRLAAAFAPLLKQAQAKGRPSAAVPTGRIGTGSTSRRSILRQPASPQEPRQSRLAGSADYFAD